MKAQSIETDVLVIGGGSAGCHAALRAHALGARVQMVVKGKMGRSGATPLASCLGAAPQIRGSYAMLTFFKKLYSSVAGVVPIPVPPTYDNAMRKMLEFHHWLVDQDYFLDFGLWAAKRFYPALEEKGIYVLRDQEGVPVVPPGKFGYYVLQSHGMTGYQYGETKRKEVLSTDVRVMEEASVFSLIQDVDGAVTGAMVIDYRSGQLYAVSAKSTILATGHTNWLSTRSTGTREMAANGLAMAARAGAELTNLEIKWFHASDNTQPDSWMRLHHYPNPLTGTDHRVAMVNRAGERYMTVEDYETVMPYTIQMKKLYEQVQNGKASWDGGSYADFSLVEPEMLKKYQYHWEFYEKLGKDMSKDALECGITWHMSAGGVRADTETMKTRIPRLHIAGAVGGHMLGALTLAAFDGEIAGTEAVRCAQRLGRAANNQEQIQNAEQRLAGLLSDDNQPRNDPGISPITVKRRIREVAWNNMMYAKTEQGLRQGLNVLAEVREQMLPDLRLRTTTASYNTDLMDALDVEDMLDVLEISAHASLARKESRGPHFREDFPFTDNENWIKQVVVSREEGRVTVRLEPVKLKYIRPKPERIDYLAVADA